MTFPNYSELINHVQSLFEDLSYSAATKWKAEDESRRIIGFMPMYIPREVVHAAGMLPVGLFGAGDRIPVVKGDAFFQSYICHIPRTVIEQALGGYMDAFDGFLFPAICDVIRNMSGIFRIKFPQKLVRYLDFPQNFHFAVGGKFYRLELEKLIADLRELNGTVITPEKLNHSIALYNRNRDLLNELSAVRTNEPHKIFTWEYYLIVRAGTVLPVEEHNLLLEQTLAFIRQLDREPEDKIRVVVSGAFCEQPPIGLIKTIEIAGCYIVEDDFQLGSFWLQRNIPDDTSDPVNELVKAYVESSTHSSAVFENGTPKGDLLAKQVRERNADGVIFCAPSFCDPALLDRPMLEIAMDKHHIKHFNFQYHENLGQFHVIKEQAGTFADMIKLWE